MKIVLQNQIFGEVVWNVPSDLSALIDTPEKTIRNALREVGLAESGANWIAGEAKSEVIGTIQRQVDTFFQLLATAHRAAKTANPPSKYSIIIERGLVWTATEMKKATTK